MTVPPGATGLRVAARAIPLRGETRAKICMPEERRVTVVAAPSIASESAAASPSNH